MKGLAAATLLGVLIFAVAFSLLFFRDITTHAMWESQSDFYQYYALTAIFGIALFPPFIPAFAPAVLCARSAKEGARAGFLVYLVIVAADYVWREVIFGAFAYDAGGSFGGTLWVYFFIILLGIMGGAFGGAIGGWRIRRTTAKGQVEKVAAEA
jgi:hypothetical protein